MNRYDKKIGFYNCIYLNNDCKLGTISYLILLLLFVIQCPVHSGTTVEMPVNSQKAEIIRYDDLRHSQTGQLIDELIQLLNDRDDYLIRQWAANKLGILKASPAIHALENTLNDPHPEVRVVAARSLGNIRSISSISPLINVLRKDSYYMVRYEAVSALGNINSQNASDAIVEALHDPDEAVREGAASALLNGVTKTDKVEQALITMLSDNNTFVRSTAASVLAKFKCSKAIDKIIQLLSDENEFTRCRVAAALSEFEDQRVIDALLNTLTDKDSSVRQFALISLAKINDNRALFSINKIAQSDPRIEVRLTAISCLGTYKNKEAANILITMLGTRYSEDIYLHTIIEALVETGDIRATDYLRNKLKGSVEERISAASLLCQVQDRNVIDDLIPLLSDESDDVRLVAIRALGQQKDKTATTHLLPFLDDQNKKIVRAAIIALGNTGTNDKIIYDKLIKIMQSENINFREPVVYSTGKLKIRGAIPYLIKMLNEVNPKTRIVVINALCNIEDITVVPNVIDLALHDVNPEVRANAITLLKQFNNNKEVIDVLTLISSTDINADVRLYASNALTNLIGKDNNN